MPADRLPVYQPTTMSYEPRGPFADTMQFLRKPMPRICIFILGVLCFGIGIAIIVAGTTDWVDSKEFKEELVGVEVSDNIDIGLILCGIFLILMSVALGALYVKLNDWRRSSFCFCGNLSKKKGLARQLQGGGANAGPVALNPSTDPLVSHTQYAPVSEIPMKIEYEERHTLMAESGGAAPGSGAEESERMLGNDASNTDSRIVLRPIGHVEDA